MSARDYHRVWISLIGLAIVIEAIALRRDGLGDTLSEWVWSKIRTPGMRAAVGALLVWLVWHFLIAGRGKLGKYDVIAVVLGAALGLAAARWGWR